MSTKTKTSKPNTFRGICTGYKSVDPEDRFSDKVVFFKTLSKDGKRIVIFAAYLREYVKLSEYIKTKVPVTVEVTEDKDLDANGKHTWTIQSIASDNDLETIQILSAGI